MKDYPGSRPNLTSSKKLLSYSVFFEYKIVIYKKDPQRRTPGAIIGLLSPQFFLALLFLTPRTGVLEHAEPR